MAGIKYLNELGENLQKIIKRLMANQTLVKYLYYTDKDPLDNPDLTDDEIRHKVYQKLIKIVPKLDNEEKANSVIALKVINGVKNPENQENEHAFEPVSEESLEQHNHENSQSRKNNQNGRNNFNNRRKSWINRSCRNTYRRN